MGVNDAREQLEVCKREYTKLEAQYAELERKHWFLSEAMYNTLAAAGFSEEMIEKIMEEYK